MKPSSSHIGTLREKPLHASLKQLYARPGDRAEVAVDGFVIDLVREDLLIEVQTRGFSSMKKKVRALLEAGHRMRIVHPVATDKWIVRIDADGALLGRRRSPRHGTATDVFAELVSFPDLVRHPCLEVDVVLTEEEEIRRPASRRGRWRKEWTVEERRLIGVVDRWLIRDVDDLAALLPPALPDPFTTADLAAGLGRPRRVAQQMAYCLRKAGVIAVVGKQGNAVEYGFRARSTGPSADA